MTEQIHHPLVLGLFLAEMVTLVIFCHQGTVHALLYRATRREELRVYAVWCLWSALFAVCYLVLHFRFPVSIYEQSFHWISICAPFGMRYYMASLQAYLGIESRWLRRLIAWQPLVALWPLASSIDSAFGGEGFFLRVRDVEPTGVLLRLVGELAPRNEVYPAFHFIVVTVVLADLAVLIHGVLHAQRRDRWIYLGIAITCGAIVFESTAMRFGFRYAVPTLFAAHLIEVLRITYMATLAVGREVATLERELERQEHVIQDQIDALATGAELQRLGERASAVGHEMRNPVASAMLFIGAARRGAAEGAPVAPLLDKLELALRQLADLLAGTVTRTRASDVGPVLLRDAVERAAILCEARVGRACASIEVQVPEHCWVRARPAALTQVFVNLFANACEAVEALRDRTIRVHAEYARERVEVRVRDAGRVSPKLASKMFASGFTTRGDGRGLGLNISQRVVTDLGGSIALDPASETTCFVVSLPAFLEGAEQAGE